MAWTRSQRSSLTGGSTTISLAGSDGSAGLAVLAFVVYLVGETLATFVIGLILILVLDPLVTWLTARGLPRPLATVVSILLLTVVISTSSLSMVGVTARGSLGSSGHSLRSRHHGGSYHPGKPFRRVR
jgi:hypothetical protein